MKLLPTREGFVEDATFLRTSEGCAFLRRLCLLMKVLWRMPRFKGLAKAVPL